MDFFAILPFLAQVLPYPFEIVWLILLLFIGVAIIIIIAHVILFILPAGIIALVVWFLTDGSLFWAGVAFLIVAFISLVRPLMMTKST